jgi:hypothetical protein
MSSEIHALFGTVIVRRISAKAPQIRPFILTGIAKMWRLHQAAIDFGNRIVFESRRYDRLAVPFGKEATSYQKKSRKIARWLSQ